MEGLDDVLSGGYPNSLGRTDEVVGAVLANDERFAEIFDCYRSADEVVRLRTSSALKRIEAARHDFLVPYIDRLIGEIRKLDQPSAQWTLAQLFDRLDSDMTVAQRRGARDVLKHNLQSHTDWIVLNHTIETLSAWPADDAALSKWLQPHLRRFAQNLRKSVAKRAAKKLKLLYGN